MKIYLIRHGATKGNRERRYVGTTDEPLLPEEKERLRQREAPPVARVYASPRKRCIETAGVLYPEKKPVIVDDLAECDFGVFEYCNYEELNGNPDYQRFIDSKGKSGFPDGESMDAFKERCLRGFYGIMQKEYTEDIMLVVHGGTVMAILDECSSPHRDYYDWRVENGGGYEAKVQWNGEDGTISLCHIKKLFT